VTVSVRPSRAADAEGILAVVDDAFSDDTRDAGEELAIVRGTWERCHGPDMLELVADDTATLVGHVLAAMGDLNGRAIPAVAPLAVVTHRQRAGVGSALVHAVIDEATARGWPLLFLLGDPRYYGRFGFEAAASLGAFYAPAGRNSPHFMVRLLPAHEDAERQLQGEFRYCWEL
jgi:putative acetyltransferase